jgi:hypothetical protein
MNRIFALIFVLIAFGLFFGYIQPTWAGDITTTRSQIDSYDSALVAASRFSANEAALEEKRNQIPGDKVARLNAFLPDSVDNVQLILDLNALATRSGVTISDFTTGETPNGGAGDSQSSEGAVAGGASSIDSLTLSVKAEGSYDAFRAFLSGIERSLRPLDVEVINISDSDTGVYSYDITLKFYWLH